MDHRGAASATAWWGCHSFAGWQVVPEGGLIHPAERTAVIADVHLGYEWARGSAGDCVPAHSLAETLTKLESMLARTPVDRLVVAGDLVETARPCVHTALEVARLAHWLDGRGIELIVLAGNHDRSLPWMTCLGAKRLQAKEPTLAETLLVAGWTIGHGHRPIDSERVIVGHHHPVLRVAGRSAPCFLVGPRWIVLPAFSPNAAGCDIATGHVPGAWREASLRCLASTGLELLDFGPLDSLGKRIRSARKPT
jgi:putative SbcD/Mre11-related phosphoesterase